MNAVRSMVAPLIGWSAPLSTWTVQVLLPLDGGAGMASTKRIFTAPSAAFASRPTAYASARGSEAQTDGVDPSLPDAPLEAEPEPHAAAPIESTRSAVTAGP